MPNSNLSDLFLAGMKSGQLVLSPEGIELKDGASDRLERSILTGLSAGQVDVVLDRYRGGGKFRIPAEDLAGVVDGAVYTAVLETIARNEIKQAWERAGGPLSKIGLPLDPKFPVHQVSPGKWVLRCRSGEVHYLQEQRKTFQRRTSYVTVRLVAIECQVRQESSDEVYGVISVHGPANRLIQTVRVPASGTLHMGRSGARLTFPNIPLVTDIPVEDLYLRVAWVENDSGNVDDIARKVSDKMREAAAAAVGALVGAGAESVAASQEETFYEAALWIVGSVLGMGDDAYPVEGKFISAGDQMSGFGPPLQPVYRRGDDTRPVERWTHDIIAQGVDDGGDLGRYRFFFEVSRADIDRTEPA